MTIEREMEYNTVQEERWMDGWEEERENRGKIRNYRRRKVDSGTEEREARREKGIKRTGRTRCR